jgi:hypothetical protein
MVSPSETEDALQKPERDSRDRAGDPPNQAADDARTKTATGAPSDVTPLCGASAAGVKTRL